MDGVMTERMTANNICPSTEMANTRNIVVPVCCTASDHLHHLKPAKDKSKIVSVMLSFPSGITLPRQHLCIPSGLILYLFLEQDDTSWSSDSYLFSQAYKKPSKATAMGSVKEIFWNWSRQCPDAKNLHKSVKAPKVLILWTFISLPFT